jgi:hypothetical protein
MDYIQKVRQENGDQILRTSTLLSYSISERFDDILPEVPGRLSYLEKEDAVTGAKRGRK